MKETGRRQPSALEVMYLNDITLRPRRRCTSHAMAVIDNLVKAPCPGSGPPVHISPVSTGLQHVYQWFTRTQRDKGSLYTVRVDTTAAIAIVSIAKVSTNPCCRGEGACWLSEGAPKPDAHRGIACDEGVF